MPQQPDSETKFPIEYEIIFKDLDLAALKEGDLDLILEENEEINELRRIVADLSEPTFECGVSSDGIADLGVIYSS